MIRTQIDLAKPAQPSSQAAKQMHRSIRKCLSRRPAQQSRNMETT